MIIGYIMLVVSGVCQGSFGLGYKKYNPLAWEAFWGIYSTFCFIIPFLWTWITAPDFAKIFADTASENFLAIAIPIICGMGWGITAVGFSKAVDKIGISLVYGLSMGISAVVGSLTPLFMQSDSNLTSNSLLLLIMGLVITLVGVAIVTKAGLIRDKETGVAVGGKSVMKLGLLLALFSGLGSAAMNIGFDFSNSIDTTAKAFGVSVVGISAMKWLLVLFGGFISSTLYCVIMLCKNKTWRTFHQKGVSKRLLILGATCIIWFAALAIYGNATYFLGTMGTVSGWIVFNALALLVSNCWGLKTGEWKNKSSKKILLIGDAVLILAWCFVGLSNL